MAASAITAVPAKEKTPVPPIDREKAVPKRFTFSVKQTSILSHHALVTHSGLGSNLQFSCPFLLRVFWSNGKPYHPNDFMRGNTPPNELQIYTWMDATLKELATLVKEVNPDARRKGTYIDFNVMFPNVHQGKYISRDIGSICIGRRGVDDLVTLKDKRFIIGDYLSIAITPPMGNRGGGPGRMRPY